MNFQTLLLSIALVLSAVSASPVRCKPKHHVTTSSTENVATPTSNAYVPPVETSESFPDTIETSANYILPVETTEPLEETTETSDGYAPPVQTNDAYDGLIITTTAPSPPKTTSPASPGSEYGDSSFIEKCLERQNIARVEVGAKPLKWDEKLAAEAASWSNKLANNEKTLVHDMQNVAGVFAAENLYGGYTTGNPESAGVCDDGSKMWIDEKKIYKGEWTLETGHYANIINPGLSKLGCGHVSGILTCRYL